MYGTDTRAYRHLDEGSNAQYLADGRRVILQRKEAIAILDVAQASSREILRIAGESLQLPQLASNDSTLFFTRRSTEGDVWLVRFGDK